MKALRSVLYLIPGFRWLDEFTDKPAGKWATLALGLIAAGLSPGGATQPHSTLGVAMNIRLHQHRGETGNLLVAIAALLFLIFIVYVGWEVIRGVRKLERRLHPNQQTNSEPSSLLRRLREAGVTTAQMQIPSFVNRTGTVPVEVLDHQFYAVQSSTNLRDWEDVEITWDEALDLARTNHPEAIRFYRLVTW